MDGGPWTLEFDGVARSFDHRPALRRVDLRLAPGDAVAVLGANGSGKSTLLRLAATLLAPTRGEVRLFGLPAGGAAAIRRRLGFVSHDSLLYDHLTVRENLVFFAGLYGVARPAADALAADLGLGPLLARRARLLSRGQRQLADLARALLPDPDLLILDEPCTGLDLDAAARLTRLLRAQKARGRTLLLATHEVSEARALADRAAVLHGGVLGDPVPAAALDEADLAARFRAAPR
jgi:ABC-type multidrug transport system ATPase subunit